MSASDPAPEPSQRPGQPVRGKSIRSRKVAPAPRDPGTPVQATDDDSAEGMAIARWENEGGRVLPGDPPADA